MAGKKDTAGKKEHGRKKEEGRRPAGAAPFVCVASVRRRTSSVRRPDG